MFQEYVYCRDMEPQYTERFEVNCFPLFLAVVPLYLNIGNESNQVIFCRFLMVNHIIGSVTSTVLAYAYGKRIAVTCLTLILVSPIYHQQLFDRFVCC